jgi:hypothetical protein
MRLPLADPRAKMKTQMGTTKTPRELERLKEEILKILSLAGLTK